MEEITLNIWVISYTESLTVLSDSAYVSGIDI